MMNPRLEEFLDKPDRALWTIALPVMAGMAIQTMYSIVDMLFIGKRKWRFNNCCCFQYATLLSKGITFGVATGLTSSISRAIAFEIIFKG